MRALRAFTVAVLGLGLIAAACGSGGTSESPAQAKATITANWQKFFDPAVPLDQKKNVVENYNGLLPILQAQSSNAQAQSIKAAVKDVTLQGDKQATVKYDIVNSKDNTPLLPGASGLALKVGNNWVVSQQTFCQLIKLADQNAKCP